MMFPYSIQIGESFNPTVREILDTGSKVIVFYFNFVDNLQYRFLSYQPDQSIVYHNLTVPFDTVLEYSKQFGCVSCTTQMELFRKYFGSYGNEFNL